MMERFDAALIEDNLPSGTPVLLAFSGGGDSRAALSVLAEHCARVGRPLGAAHLDHAIRPASAEDAAFCAAVCAELGVTFHTRRVDVPAMAEGGLGLEEAARNARYAFFAELMAEQGYGAVITAHQADDNLETMLMRLVRGSGLRGLCGIPPVRPLGSGLLLRPFLRVSRAEMEEYLHRHGLVYLTDETNTDRTYLRNRLRAEVIPVLSACNPTLLCRTADTAEALRADAAYLEQAAEQLYETLPTPNCAPADWLREQPDAMRRRLFLLLYRGSGGSGMPEQTHFRALDRLLAEGRQSSSLSLPGAVTARLDGGELTFFPEKAECPPPDADWQMPARQGRVEIPELGALLCLGEGEEMGKFVNNLAEGANIYRLFINRCLNFDKIIGWPHWRLRRAGDCILLGGHHRSVKKLLSAAGIPVALRERLPILCDEEGIVFLPGVGLRDGLDGGSSTLAVIFPRDAGKQCKQERK